jgi:hypothetical protein
MSSVLRSYAQIPARVKYFIALETKSASNGNNLSPNFVYPATIRLPTYPSPVLTESELLDAFDDPAGYTFPAIGTGLLKDLGQQFIVTDADYNYRAIYRRVQYVNGENSEGVGGHPTTNGWNTFYVKTWDSDATTPNPVIVARTG